ncbi:rhodanese-like domain-containing protein [Sulfurovum sp. zt1-1]|uniref:Rhodanese-like domain-containing protein n=1 Tax=Sulfurovum zhangzhouensis TaxID=3019067 RepID=A0ABT7QWQ6_9BACT|nr:rhodanese-like domain-containing protein [Sulfurovum zhangzhouensis]MDM5271255.1 rhodanese-like domain-containing protein [Sulfurovum zhangzhouensis]
MKFRLLLAVLTAAVTLYAGQYDKVKITPDMSYVYIYHKGKAVKVHRIQDTKHKLTGEYAKTYRPGQYIQPINLKNGVQTIGEVEVLKFMKAKVNEQQGMLIDVRDREHYKKESIPSAVNIPAKIRQNDIAMNKIFKSLGMEQRDDGSWDASRAMDLVIYCDGIWCKKSTEMIGTLLDRGYPAEKISYYRGGFQMWKILGFTTVRN